MQQLVVIVFAREPTPGQVKTRLAAAIGAENAAMLADAFIRDALAKARLLHGARVAIAASSPDGAHSSRYFRKLASEFGARVIDQGPGDLGARMARVLQPLARRGKAILFGTDTPSLPVPLLQHSVRALDNAVFVVSPTLDGGYYLVGACGRLPMVWNGIQWGGPRVMRATLARLRVSGHQYSIGPWWYDVDRPEDLALLHAHLTGRLAPRWSRALALGRPFPCPETAAVMRRLF